VSPRADAAQVAAQAAEPRNADLTASPAASAPTEPSAEPSSQGKTPRVGGALAATPTKISGRHVLVQWMGSDRAGKSVLRTREQAMVLAKEVLRRARAGEDLGRLAVEYSDEPNAGPRGGSLGRFGKGQMVAGFEQVAFQLEVGQISDIVETPFGFHIIQRTE
jgi:parvulin-like peptidyl-prolyl isomerase